MEDYFKISIFFEIREFCVSVHEESALQPYNSVNIHARKKIKPVLETPGCLLLYIVSETCEFQIWKNGACLDQKSLCNPQ